MILYHGRMKEQRTEKAAAPSLVLPFSENFYLINYYIVSYIY